MEAVDVVEDDSQRDDRDQAEGDVFDSEDPSSNSGASGLRRVAA